MTGTVADSNSGYRRRNGNGRGGSDATLGGALGASAELQLGLATAAGTMAAGIAVQQASATSPN